MTATNLLPGVQNFVVNSLDVCKTSLCPIGQYLLKMESHAPLPSVATHFTFNFPGHKSRVIKSSEYASRSSIHEKAAHEIAKKLQKKLSPLYGY